MEVYEQEIFGPARNVVRVDSLEEAITLINKHELGNGVTIFTNDGLAARKFTTEIDVGMVGVNVPIPIPLAIITLQALKALVLVRGICLDQIKHDSLQKQRQFQSVGWLVMPPQHPHLHSQAITTNKT